MNDQKPAAPVDPVTHAETEYTSLDAMEHHDLRIRLAEPEVEDDPSDPMNHVHADLRIRVADDSKQG